VLVPAETRPGERRVALVPESVGKIVAMGLEVLVEAGAGQHAWASDEDYRTAGATIVPADGMKAAYEAVEAVVTVRPLEPRRAALVKSGAVTLSFLQPVADIDTVRELRDRGATALSFDLLPRISRAQSMDALTSQALCTGYRAVLIGADHLPKFFPMFMTAAGTITPAKVVVLGVGVAGLQAIATARRLGAVVSANDVRASSAAEVQSMGAKFISLDVEAEGTGGYARELGEDRAARQRELLAPHIADADVVITTAAIPGRPAPLLVTAEMVARMRPGSVLVDLAAESGGNVEGSVAGEVVVVNGVKIVGGKDVASELPVHASKLYGQNIVNLFALFCKEGEINPDLEDEVVAGCAIVFNGEVRNEAARAALGEAPIGEGA
jgi:NAD(P) transhydrogenase subunit alpha